MRYVWIDAVSDDTQWSFMGAKRQAWELIYDTRTGVCYTVPMVMTRDGWATTNLRNWNAL